MNLTGLVIALSIAVVVGAVFAIFPQLDVAVSSLFYDFADHRFVGWGVAWLDYARNAATLLIAFLVAPAFLAVAGKLIFPNRPMLIPGRAAVFLIATLTLGPGILANGVFKEYSARMRPTDVAQLSGSERFTPWWDFGGPCPDNCSFIAGEPSGAFWIMAPAALTPPQWRALAYAGALAFGVAMAVLRMAVGAHFFTDCVFAGVFMFLVVWTFYGLIYRWRATRFADEAVERPLAHIGTAIRAWFVRRRRGDRAPS